MDGLRFECQPGCTKCCNVRGFVYLSEQDLLKLAAYLQLTPAEFEASCVFRTRHLLRLRKPRDRQCRFLTDTGCSVHPAKPTQCRLYPFWPELVEDRDVWNCEARKCPGIHQGGLIQIGTALEIASQMKTAYPGLY